MRDIDLVRKINGARRFRAATVYGGTSGQACFVIRAVLAAFTDVPTPWTEILRKTDATTARSGRRRGALWPFR